MFIGIGFGIFWSQIFGGGNSPVLSGTYVAEDGAAIYVAENGTDVYVTET